MGNVIIAGSHQHQPHKGQIMKTAIKAMLLAAVACACSTQAFGYTIHGTIPAGRRPVVIHLRKPLPPGFLRFTFYAPPVNAHVPYAITFCIGPAANPCGLPTDYTVEVPAGQTRTGVVNSALLRTNIFVVGQGTRVPVPYSVTVQ
jgi:hypothetical protein